MEHSCVAGATPNRRAYNCRCPHASNLHIAAPAFCYWNATNAVQGAAIDRLVDARLRCRLDVLPSRRPGWLTGFQMRARSAAHWQFALSRFAARMAGGAFGGEPVRIEAAAIHTVDRLWPVHLRFSPDRAALASGRNPVLGCFRCTCRLAPWRHSRSPRPNGRALLRHTKRRITRGA